MEDAGFMFSILWLLFFSVFFLITFFNVVIRKNYARCLKHKFITGVGVWAVVSTLFFLSRLWPSAVTIFFKIGCFSGVIAGIFYFLRSSISAGNPSPLQIPHIHWSTW